MSGNTCLLFIYFILENPCIMKNAWKSLYSVVGVQYTYNGDSLYNYDAYSFLIILYLIKFLVPFVLTFYNHSSLYLLSLIRPTLYFK